MWKKKEQAWSGPSISLTWTQSSKQLSHSSFPQIRFIRLEESFSLHLVQVFLRCRWILGSLVWSVSGCKVLRCNKASLLVWVNWLQIGRKFYESELSRASWIWRFHYEIPHLRLASCCQRTRLNNSRWRGVGQHWNLIGWLNFFQILKIVYRRFFTTSSASS